MASNVSRLVSMGSPGIQMVRSPRTTPSPVSIRGQLSIDPLLANLSPSSVLEALRTSDATILPSSASKEQSLTDSISEASPQERALGIRAALAGKRIREWIVELQAWTWPEETFQPPAYDQHSKYWGSLPSKVVLDRENRLERIKDGLALLETEDLKNYVRNVHLQSPARKTSHTFSSSPETMPYNRLADFNVLITAVIVQSLPDLAILTRLLGIWSSRVLILKQIPSLFEQLREAKLGLESAWITIEQATKSGAKLVLTRETYGQIKQILEERITNLAKSIDAILDALEGHEDRIPDHWIDEVEEAESDYKDWVVEAERLVRLYEWQASRQDEKVVPLATDSEQVDDYDLSSVLPTSASTVTSGKDNSKLAKSSFTAKQPLHATRPSQVESYPGSHDLLLDKPVSLIQKLDMPDTTSKRISNHITSRVLPLHTINTENTDLGSNGLPNTHPYSTKLDSPIDIVQKVVLPKSYNYEEAANNSTSDHILEKVDKASSISPRDHNTADQSTHEYSVPEPGSSVRADSLSLLFTSKKDNDDMATGTMQPTGESPALEFSAQQQIESIQQELNDALEDSQIPDQSPSLMVRKVRLPLQTHDAIGKSHSTAEQVIQPVEDKMTAKISQLLTDIPAPIKLAIHPPRKAIDARAEGKSMTRPQHQPLSAPALTLSPVATKTKSLKSNDLGVRVYHLHQSGKDVPIKLFIRLVGTEERVMVRVGGGWADLAEYLKEYAMHHGRRSVSNNNFELEGHPSAQSAAYNILEASQSPSSSVTGTPSRRPVTPQFDWTSEPHTPESTGKAESSAASSESYRFHPRSILFAQEDDNLSLGLGGPKGKKIELSPQKRAWVDGMLGQARQISSEHKKTEDIGDLGKVGNTKRVYLRGRGDSFTPK